jgi:hypothetical protein
MVLLPFTWMELFCTKWCSSHLKSLRSRQYSFHKLTQFSQENNVLDPPASYIQGFFTRDTLVHSLTWRSNFVQSSCSSHMKTLKVRQCFFQKLTQFPQGNFVLQPPASHIDGFLTREIILVPFTWMEQFCTKLMFLTHEKNWVVGSIVFNR